MSRSKDTIKAVDPVYLVSSYIFPLDALLGTYYLMEVDYECTFIYVACCYTGNMLLL